MRRHRKIVVIGPESTGKSTLCAALSQATDCPWVPEYARHYLEKLPRQYEEADLLEIARGQLADEEQASMGVKSPWLFCDTDLHVLRVWAEHRYGRCDRWILEQIAVRHYDAYILTDIDLPWQPDPLREHPDEHMRHYFFRQYLDTVIESGLPWVRVSGNETSRLHTALDFIHQL